MFELGSGIVSSKLPINAFLQFVSCRNSWHKQCSECRQVRYPAVRNTLTPESRKLYLSNIQPAAMLWRVMYLKPLGEFSCVLRRKSRIKRSDAVSVQIIHDQNDFFSIGILLCKQPFYLLCPVLTGSAFLRIGISPA